MEDLKCYKGNCKSKPSGYCDCTSFLTIFCEHHAYHHMRSPAAKHHRNLELYKKPDSQTRWLVIDALHKLKIDVKICKKNLVFELAKLFNCLKNWGEKSISLMDEIESRANKYLKEAVRVTEVPNLPKVGEISLALRLPVHEAEQRLAVWKLKRDWLDLSGPIKAIDESFLKNKLSPFEEIYGQKFTANKLRFFYNWTTKLVSIDLDSKISNITKMELPQNIDYGVGMCPIPGNKIFCYGNWSWGFKDLTFIIDELYNFEILPPGKPNNNLNVVCYNNKIYALGGAKNVSEKFSLSKVKWKPLKPLPKGDYASSTSIVFGDTILMTAISCKNILNYHIKRNEYEILIEPALNDGTHKKLFSYEGKVFLVEASGSLYESLKGDIMNWNCIGTNSIQKAYFASFEVHSNNSIYFINRWAKLIHFDKISKEIKEEKFT